MVGHVLNEITKGLDRVAAYLDDVIVFDADRSLHVAIMKEFFLRLRKHNLKLSPSKATIGATDANFLGHAISPAGVMPNAQTVEALMKMSVPKNLKQVRSLLGDYSEYRKFLRDMAKRIWPIISLVKQGVKFVFTPAMETIVRELLAELSTPPVPVCPMVTWRPAPPMRWLLRRIPAIVARGQRVREHNHHHRAVPLVATPFPWVPDPRTPRASRTGNLWTTPRMAP